MIRTALFASLVSLLFLDPVSQHESFDDDVELDNGEALSWTSDRSSHQLENRRTVSPKKKVWKKIQIAIHDLRDDLLIPIVKNVTYMQHVLLNIVNNVISVQKEVREIKGQSQAIVSNLTDARKDRKRLMNRATKILNNVTLTLYEIGRISRHLIDVHRNHGMINERLEMTLEKVNDIPTITHLLNDVKSDSRRLRIEFKNSTSRMESEMDLVQSVLISLSNVVHKIQNTMGISLEKMDQCVGFTQGLLKSNISSLEGSIISHAANLNLMDTKLIQLLGQVYEQSEKIMGVWNTLSGLSESVNDLNEGYMGMTQYLEILRESIMSLGTKIDVMHNRINNLDSEMQKISSFMVYTRNDMNIVKKYLYDVWNMVRTKCLQGDPGWSESATDAPARPGQPDVIPGTWHLNDSQAASFTEGAFPIPTPAYPPLPFYPPAPILPGHLPPSILPGHLPPSILPGHLPPSSPAYHPIPPSYPSASGDLPSIVPSFGYLPEAPFDPDQPTLYSSTEKPMPIGLPLGQDRPGLPIGSGAQFTGHCACICPCDCSCPKADPRIPVYVITKYENVRYVMPGYGEEAPNNQCHCLCTCPCRKTPMGANGNGNQPTFIPPQRPGSSPADDLPSHHIPWPNPIPAIPPFQVPPAAEGTSQTDKSWYLHLLNEILRGHDLTRRAIERLEAISKAEQAAMMRFVSEKVNTAISFVLQEMRKHFDKSMEVNVDVLRTVRAVQQHLQEMGNHFDKSMEINTDVLRTVQQNLQQMHKHFDDSMEINTDVLRTVQENLQEVPKHFDKGMEINTAILRTVQQNLQEMPKHFDKGMEIITDVLRTVQQSLQEMPKHFDKSMEVNTDVQRMVRTVQQDLQEMGKHLDKSMEVNTDVLRTVQQNLQDMPKHIDKSTEISTDVLRTVRAVQQDLQDMPKRFDKSMDITTDILRSVHTLQQDLLDWKEREQRYFQSLVVHIAQIQKGITANAEYQYISGLNERPANYPPMGWAPYQRPPFQQPNFVLPAGNGQAPLFQMGSSSIFALVPLGTTSAPLIVQLQVLGNNTANDSMEGTPTLSPENPKVARRVLLGGRWKGNSANARRSNGDQRKNKITEGWLEQKDNGEARTVLPPRPGHRTEDENYVRGDQSRIGIGKKRKKGTSPKIEIALLNNSMNRVDTLINPFALHTFREKLIRSKTSALRPHTVSGGREGHLLVGKWHGRKKSRHRFAPRGPTILPKSPSVRSPVRLSSIVPSVHYPYMVAIRPPAVSAIPGDLPPGFVHVGTGGSAQSVSYNDGRGNSWNVNVNKRDFLRPTGGSDIEHETDKYQQKKEAKHRREFGD